MKYAKFILFLVAVIVASCTINDDVDNGKNNSGKLRLLSRVVPFEGYDVHTRATNEGFTENDIVTLDYIILALKDGVYRCVYYKHYAENNVNEVITVDRSEDFEELNANGDSAILDNCIVSVVANYPEIYEKIESEARASDGFVVDGQVDTQRFIDSLVIYKGKDSIPGKDANYFMVVPYNVEPTLGVPSTGLPRLGNYADENGIYVVNLNNLHSGQTYEVKLEALYAKMFFDIKVDAIQEILGVNGNTFSLDSFSVFNLARNLDMKDRDENNQPIVNDDVTVYAKGIKGSSDLIINTDYDDRLEQFICYLPERYTAPNSTYTYPFVQSDGTIRAEDEKLRQRYKPKLVEGLDPGATYVRFYGKFVNHQGHLFNVSYDIYVGNDNYGNFDVVRNRQYNNYITIKGIDNSIDQSPIDTAVSIDHRVNVTRESGIIINLRRETLLDAHFEVRPLRIRAKGENPTNTVAEIEVIYDNEPTSNWIGLERSFGNGTEISNSTTYCTGTTASNKPNNSAKGKRKYFTTNLTTETLALTNVDKSVDSKYSGRGGRVVRVPIDPDGECVWIYVDECLDASNLPNAIRSAIIRVRLGNYSGTEFVASDSVDYILNQHKLFEVTYKGFDGVSRTYYIEHEEEYLHNFDADDTYSYNKTEFEGMMWGLDGAQLSFDSKALVIANNTGWLSSLIASLMNYFVQRANPPFYDYYIGKHDKMNSVDKFDYKGKDFCDSIIYTINHSTTGRYTGYSGNIGILALDQQPQSAIEYCYNRNKRDADGNVVATDWYLPAIDEMEDIMMGGYNAFEVFQDKFYWSCQPAYYKCLLHYNIVIDEEYDYYVDNVNRARATRTIYLGANNYDYEKSGASGIYNIMHVYESGQNGVITYNLKTELGNNDSWSYDYEVGEWIFKWTETNTFTKSQLPVYEKGNLPRTKKCRVRAVRKTLTPRTTNT